MTFKQLKTLIRLCEYLEIKTLKDLAIFKKSCKIKDNKTLLNALYLETTFII